MPIRGPKGVDVPTSIFFDDYDDIGADYTTDTAVNGTVSSVSGAAEIKHSDEEGSYAEMRSTALYKVPFFALISAKFDAGNADSLRRLGFKGVDWDDGIFIRMDGTTYRFVVKTGGTESTYIITDDLTAYSDWIIHATATSIKLILGDTVKTEITTNIPQDYLSFIALGAQQ